MAQHTLKLVAKSCVTEGRVRSLGGRALLAWCDSIRKGRENISLNGSMLGFSRNEMAEKIPRIIEFSELDEFIDAPLRTYSSGMWARLGFAVATDDRPEILIVDEILGVGDEAFQRKCTARIDQYRNQGATILLVSHNSSLIESMCQRVAWLDHGQLRGFGETREILHAYRASQG
jgi:ABC-type polysaccharide/polyol phosphate transport system ATPase subunit